jgi:hypothetical protein
MIYSNGDQSQQFYSCEKEEAKKEKRNTKITQPKQMSREFRNRQRNPTCRSCSLKKAIKSPEAVPVQQNVTDSLVQTHQ